MKFALALTPANYILFSMHAANIALQSRLLAIKIAHNRKQKTLALTNGEEVE